MDIQKKCSVCNIEKSLDSFYKSQRGTKCIDCVLKVTREYKRKKRLDSNFRKEEGRK
jgi:hypothetical protein